ncbi:hypothetical protein GGS24DRAFT_501979 [Hypoxylon argillaceum]|nr:hypothetical protein GGS24DRAFT_501979 [Hypoxylon argillaceum]
MSGRKYRTGQNLCSASCPVNHIAIPANELQEPRGGWPDIRGLHSLNYSRDAWLAGDAIEVSIGEVINGLPRELKERIDLAIPGVDPRVWHKGPDGYDALMRALKSPARRAFRKMRTTEYSFLPICTDGNHWVLVVIHKLQRPILDDPAGGSEWSHVAQMGVFDSYRDTVRVKMVQERMREWLERSGGFTFAPTYKKTAWVPMQNDINSCGPRAYWVAKQFLARLLRLYERSKFYESTIWKDFSGWFNEDFERGEMMGRCAWAAVRAMDYRARVAVECVNQVREYQRPNAAWQDAGELMNLTGYGEPQLERRPPTTGRAQGGVVGTNEDGEDEEGEDGGGNQPPAKSTRPLTMTGYNMAGAGGSTTGSTGTTWMPPAPYLSKRQMAPGASPESEDIEMGNTRTNPNPNPSPPRAPSWPEGERSGNPFIVPRARPAPAAAPAPDPERLQVGYPNYSNRRPATTGFSRQPVGTPGTPASSAQNIASQQNLPPMPGGMTVSLTQEGKLTALKPGNNLPASPSVGQTTSARGSPGGIFGASTPAPAPALAPASTPRTAVPLNRRARRGGLQATPTAASRVQSGAQRHAQPAPGGIFGTPSPAGQTQPPRARLGSQSNPIDLAATGDKRPSTSGTAGTPKRRKTGGSPGNG